MCVAAQQGRLYTAGEVPGHVHCTRGHDKQHSAAATCNTTGMADKSDNTVLLCAWFQKQPEKVKARLSVGRHRQAGGTLFHAQRHMS